MACFEHVIEGIGTLRRSSLSIRVFYESFDPSFWGRSGADIDVNGIAVVSFTDSSGDVHKRSDNPELFAWLDGQVQDALKYDDGELKAAIYADNESEYEGAY
jgi:hypothetical protein